MSPLDIDIKGEIWSYDHFPNLNIALFNVPRPVQNFIKDANNAVKWKVDNKSIQKMNDSKWVKFLYETIFVLWFYAMTVSMPKYGEHSIKIFKYSKTVLEFLKKSLKTVKEIEFIYRKLFEACMKCKLLDEATKLRDEMKNIAFAFQDTSQRTFIPTDITNLKKQKVEEEKKEEDLTIEDEAAEISYIFENVVILSYTKCMNTTCNYLIREEEIMSGWQKSMNEYVSQCPLCKAKFVPKLNLFTDSDHNSLSGREGMEVQWLPPSCLLKEYTNCVSQRGENIILKEDFRIDHKTIFWNLIFYFKLLKLPCFFLDNYYNPAHTFRQTENLEPYMPIDIKKKGSSKTSKLTLSKDALSKLNDATIEHKFDLLLFEKINLKISF